VDCTDHVSEARHLLKHDSPLSNKLTCEINSKSHATTRSVTFPRSYSWVLRAKARTQALMIFSPCVSLMGRHCPHLQESWLRLGTQLLGDSSNSSLNKPNALTVQGTEVRGTAGTLCTKMTHWKVLRDSGERRHTRLTSSPGRLRPHPHPILGPSIPSPSDSCHLHCHRYLWLPSTPEDPGDTHFQMLHSP
jgi:hypothetical protein